MNQCRGIVWGTHLKQISKEVLEISIREIENTLVLPHLSEANELFKVTAVSWCMRRRFYVITTLLLRHVLDGLYTHPQIYNDHA